VPVDLDYWLQEQRQQQEQVSMRWQEFPFTSINK
jgi:hypothetical protein